MRAIKILGLVTLASLAACGMNKSETSAGSSAAPATSPTAAASQSQGNVWNRCMLQGEMAACQEIWKSM